MTPKLAVAFVSVVLFAGACSGGDDEAATACDLLSRSDIAEVMQREVSEGRPTALGTGCEFTIPEPGMTRVAVAHFDEVDNSEFERVRDSVDSSTPQNLGDNSFSWSRSGSAEPGSSDAAGGEALTSAGRYSVVIYGDEANEDRAAVLLAKLVAAPAA